MARLAVYQNLTIHMKELADLFMLVFDGTTPVMRTTDEAAYSYADGFFSVYGTLSYTDGQLTSGTIDRIEITPNSGSWIDLGDLALDVETVLAAVQSDAAGAGANDAVENLVYGLGWTIIGRHTQDSFLKDEISSDGVAISFSGNDVLNLADGQDSFHAGDGHDKVFGQGDDDTLWGGAGRDTISGGNGKDRIEGGIGADMLMGGRQNDRLSGSWGNDAIDGGLGHDILIGGRGNDLLRGNMGIDRLTGGQGADTFKFKESDFTGFKDLITDFEIGVDRILIDMVNSPSYTVSEISGDTYITIASSLIIVEGVSQIDFESDAGNLVFM